MSRKATDADVDNAIKDYLANDSIETVAARYHVSYQRVAEILKAQGLLRSLKESRRISADKMVATLRSRSPWAGYPVIFRYLQGESENSLAKSFGVSRTAIARYLKFCGVPRRDPTEANRLLAEQTPQEEHHRRIKIAQDAVRGSHQSPEHRARIAQGRQRLSSGVSQAEIIFAHWLEARGLAVVPQQAIGPYNVDIGTAPIAVEILGGSWHASKPIHPKRTRYLLDQGWHLVFVWTHARRSPLAERAADYVVAFLDELRRNPPTISQYRVIRGDGHELARGQADGDNISLVAPGYESANARASD